MEKEFTYNDYKFLMEQASDAIFISDPLGKFIDVNPKACEFLGYDREELLELYIKDLIPSHILKIAPPRLDELNQGKKLVTQREFIRKDGKTVYGELTSNKLKNGNLLAIARDITAKKLSEEIESKKSRELKTILNNVPDIITRVDRDFRYIYVNPAILVHSEAPMEYFIGKRHTDFLPEEKSSFIESKLKEVLETGKEVIFEYSYDARIGEVWYHSHCVPEFSENGEVESILTIAKDITAIKNNEKIIRDNEYMYKMLMEQASDAIFITNRNGEFVVINTKACEMLGYSKEELFKMNAKELRKEGQTQDEQIKLMNGQTVVFERKLICKDGSEIDAEISVKVLENGTFQSIVRDISIRKKAESVIHSSLKEKEILLKEIHHRVKNNLQIISSLLNLQSNYIKDSSAYEMFKDSQNRIKTMAHIHEKLYQSQDLSSINFSEYINDLIYSLFKIYKSSSDIELNMDLCEVILNIDVAIPCGLIINEIISNSLKYAFTNSKKGCINIQLMFNNKEITLILNDNGKGLPEDIDFENSSTLGLQLISMLCEQINAKIKLNRENGTEFIISIPDIEVAQ